MNKVVKKETKNKAMNGKLQKAEFEYIQTQDHSFVYADNSQVRLSLYDIKILFGVTQGKTPEGKVAVAAHTTLAMSPQHAKALVGLLEQTLAQYEKDFMPITLGEHIFNQLDKE